MFRPLGWSFRRSLQCHLIRQTGIGLKSKRPRCRSATVPSKAGLWCIIYVFLIIAPCVDRQDYPPGYGCQMTHVFCPYSFRSSFPRTSHEVIAGRVGIRSLLISHFILPKDTLEYIICNQYSGHLGLLVLDDDTQLIDVCWSVLFHFYSNII